MGGTLKKGRRALVTGASGFIGSRLCRRLGKEGMTVHGISRQTRNSDTVRWWKGDLSDPDQVRTIVREARPDLVFHLGSYVGAARDLSLVMPTFYYNLASTVHLMDACAQVGIERFIFLGSQDEPTGSQRDIIPSSPYAAAKWASAAYLRMFWALYNFPAVHLQVFMVYGPGQRDLKKIVPYVILETLRGNTPKINSSSREVDWIYVDDVVEATLKAASAPRIEGQTVEIGTGVTEDVQGLVERLIRIVNPAISAEYREDAARKMEVVRKADVESAYRQIGWRSQIELNEGLRLTVDWFKARFDSGELTT